MRRTKCLFTALCLMLTAATPALAGKRHADAPTLASAKHAVAASKLRLASAKGEAKLAAHRLKLAKAQAAVTKAQHKLAVEAWIEQCIYERTGPTEGITEGEAAVICAAEVPDEAGDDALNAWAQRTLGQPIITPAVLDASQQ
jgi:hypothetical protein